jgi:hypothetical protein
MNMQFKDLCLADRDRIDEFYKRGESRSCDDCFANLYLWRRTYPVEYLIKDDVLFVRSKGRRRSWRFPQGDPDKLAPALEEMISCSHSMGTDFRMLVVTPEQFARMEEAFPGRFRISYQRDLADYVYEREKLASLAGKKYHGKKNHVNKFVRTYPDWKYEPITDENVEDCFQMAMEWRREEGISDEKIDPELEEVRSELAVSLNALRLLKELHLTGGCLRVNGKVCAFTIGEPLSSDTYVVHIEKALPEIEGAYTMINQQFVQNEMDGFTYVNREDDTGDEGLRTAKLSYRPVMMTEKGIVTLK